MAIDVPGAVLRALPTPCLIVDLAACRRNIAVAATRGPVRLRPHFKAHKCTALMREQLSGGGCAGVTCATAYEAEVLAGAGFTDILLANQVVDAPGLGALARAAKHDGVRLGVAVDHRRHIDLLDALSREHRIRLDVLIEIDVGMGRCGLAPRDPLLLDLARAVDCAPNLRLRGLQAYEGHAVLIEDRAERRACVHAAAAVLVEERARLREAGFPCEVISGGGTGTLDLVAEAGVLTEVQAGSYPLLDATYGTLGLGFENALYVVATTLSVARPGCATLNAGLKAISAEYGMPVSQPPGLTIHELADEHALATLDGTVPLEVGQPVLLVPAHIDPTINLHDTLFVWDRATATLDRWAVRPARHAGRTARRPGSGPVARPPPPAGRAPPRSAATVSRRGYAPAGDRVRAGVPAPASPACQASGRIPA